MLPELGHSSCGQSHPLQAPVTQTARVPQHLVEVGDGIPKLPNGDVQKAPPLSNRGGRFKGRGSQPLTHSQGPGVVSKRLLVGVGSRRFIAGLRQVVQGLLPILALIVVMGQHLVLFKQPVGIELLDGGTDDPVQRLPTLHQQRGVGHVVGEGVFEHVGEFGEVRLLVDQLEGAQL